MQRRFFSESAISDGTVILSGPDAHHVANVIRLKNGDTIRVFDGSGQEFECLIQEIRKKEVIARVVCNEYVSRELPAKLTIYSAIPKGDRQKFMIEKLVELGVSCLVPLNCSRSVVVSKEKPNEKMHRWVIEASKQCGRNSLMTIQKPASFGELVSLKTEDVRVVVHPNDFQLSASEFVREIGPDSKATIAVGPEGGFTDSEIEIAKSNGWHVVGLGMSILRIETAAIAAASIFGIGRG